MSDPVAPWFAPAFAPGVLRALLEKPQGHKYDHGHALVLTGGMGRTGAARLSARAALRVGAGLVTLGAPGGAMLECAAQITALMLRRVEGAEELSALLADPRINALCLGPGLGVDRAAALLPGVLGRGGAEPRPVAGTPGAVRGKHAPYGGGMGRGGADTPGAVPAGHAPYNGALLLDADALTALAPLAATLPAATVLTPHGGEFARLFPDLPQTDAGLCAAAARAGCVVLLKGVTTRIAAPDGRLAIHEATGARAVPWLATAGAGDVLAGLICGLMARGRAPFDAACAGVWLHVEAARLCGPGLIAEDLPEAIPAALRALLSA